MGSDAFPFTLYREQWEKLLGLADKSEASSGTMTRLSLKRKRNDCYEIGRDARG
jgi:hypothetical protein